MASGRVPNTVNTFTVTLLYFLRSLLLYLVLMMQSRHRPFRQWRVRHYDGRRRDSTTPAPTNTPIAPHRTAMNALRGLSRLIGSSGVRR